MAKQKKPVPRLFVVRIDSHYPHLISKTYEVLALDEWAAEQMASDQFEAEHPSRSFDYEPFLEPAWLA